MKFFPLLLIALLMNPLSAHAAESEAVTITAINTPCAEPAPGDLHPQRPCSGRDALFFVHGIYGGRDTFKNGTFDWPAELAKELPDVDVYVIEYRTKLLSWLKRDVASFDEVSDGIFAALQGKPRPGWGDIRDGLLAYRQYRSIGFVAHSLGGNVAAAYIHTVKSELGHEERARNAFLITLGTPANGAQIANVGVVVKTLLHTPDPLLRSLERDNTFLRMLTSWRNAESRKATRFQCRPVSLYVGIEGTPTYGMTVVSRESAEEPYRDLAREVRVFEKYDHARIAKPADATDPVYIWVRDIVRKEQARMKNWGAQRLCLNPC